MQTEFRNQDKYIERRLEAVAADVCQDLQPWYISFVFFPFQKERGHSSSEWINEAAPQNKVNRPGSALRQFINITPAASCLIAALEGKMKIPER